MASFTRFTSRFPKTAARSLQEILENEYDGNIRIEFERDPGSTGNFEVTLLNTGALIHSKKAGLGRCESSKETQVGLRVALRATWR
jgi:selT/selW/selH-like putative selenoprotein